MPFRAMRLGKVMFTFIANTSPMILSIGNKLHMFRIHTPSSSTQMINMETIWNFAVQ